MQTPSSSVPSKPPTGNPVDSVEWFRRNPTGGTAFMLDAFVVHTDDADDVD